jgi:hypothetical protein
MKQNYKLLSESIKNRLNPENLPVRQKFAAELASLSYSDVLTFVRMAMKSVDFDYTKRSKDAGERAKEHLDRELNDVAFRFQGSVMTNTHIKGHSDIDLLTICDKFYTWDRYNSNRYLTESSLRSRLYTSQIAKLESETTGAGYAGDTLSDLRQLRNDSEAILRKKYLICDTSGAKSIKITNQDLKRDVDVVIANWYDDVKSIINDKGEYRGVQVYDKDRHEKGDTDFPFLSIKRINERGDYTDGRLRKMIRFLKNIKAFSEYEIDLSSFDINAICYDIAVSSYQYAPFTELVKVLYAQLKSICTNENHANEICSVDEREYIFRGNPGKLNNVKMIFRELEKIYSDLRQQID